MKWMITAEVHSKVKYAAKGSKIRTEIICNKENKLFRGCTTREDIQRAYENFWNNNAGLENVTVLGVEPLFQIVVSNG